MDADSRAREYDVGGLGAISVDFTSLVTEWPKEGHKHRVESVDVRDGGVVATALVAVSRLQGTALFLGKLGSSDLARRAIAALDEAGVDTGGVLRKEGCEPVWAFILANQTNGRRTIFYSKDSVSYPFPVDYETVDFLGECKTFLFDTGSGGAGVEFARCASDLGVPTILDADSFYTSTEEAVALADHLVAPLAFGRRLAGFELPHAVMDCLRSRPGQTVVLTDGENGGYATGPEGDFRFPAFAVEVLDSTGCGDVFHGVYSWALARGMNARRRCELAAGAAALAATKIGGREGIPDRSGLLAFLEERGVGWVRELLAS